MFDSSDPSPAAPPTGAEFAADTLLLAGIAGAARAENRDAFAKVDAAIEFHRGWMGRRENATPRRTSAWSHAGWVEIATTLACSTTTAAHHVELGVALRTRLPRIRAAFAEGEIDYAKAWRLATATDGFSDTANPGRQVLIHPCPDSTFRIDWQVPGDYDLDAEEASGVLDARIRQIIGDTDYRIVWKSVYRFHSRVASSMRVGRFLLAGDAAHIVSPFGARGLNSGVADAENAAWKLAYVLHGWAGDGLLHTYHTERHTAACENLSLTAATMDFLVPQNGEQADTRAQVLDDVRRDPGAHAGVDSGRLAEPFWYVESPLTTPDPLRPFAGRPDRGHAPLPAPGVLIPNLPVQWNGRQTRLGAIARDGFLLLTSDAAVVHTQGDVPVTAAAMSDLDPTGALRAALGDRPAEAWLIRPDAHIAAALGSADAVDTALRRAVALRTREWLRS